MTTTCAISATEADSVPSVVTAIAAEAAAPKSHCSSGKRHHCPGCSRQALPEQYKRNSFGSVLADWIPVVLSTLGIGTRKPSRFVSIWSKLNRVECDGLDNLPREGLFLLAANHIRGEGSVTSLVGAILTAVSQARPDAVDDMQLMVGTREPRSKLSPLVRLVRSIWSWAKQRWSNNLITMPMANEKRSHQMLFQWRRAVMNKPAMLFPEGISRSLFGPVRDGCGGMLKLAPAATVPVAVFFEHGRWHVRFGEPIPWSKRSELLDVQLGLEIAKLLPLSLVDEQWRRLLERLGGLAPEGE